MKAVGSFEVKLMPQPAYAAGDDPRMGRLGIDKRFHGDIEATSKGEMLSASTETRGSAGYVAMERVSGTVHGRQGTFILQHSGSMRGGNQELSVTVVPDSGTGELAGMAGAMRIIIEGGAHAYEFDYTFD